MLLAAGFAWGVVYLLSRQFESGEVYPEYSSLRADPLGLQAAVRHPGARPGSCRLAQLHGPLRVGARDRRAAAGMAARGTGGGCRDPAQDAAARGSASWWRPWTRARIPATRCRSTNPGGSRWRSTANPRQSHPLYFAGRARLDRGRSRGREDSGAGKELRQGQRGALGGERAISPTNPPRRATASTRSPAALGPNRRVVFDERHLGIAESGSVVALARRFRLSGFALGLGLCAALFLWRNAAAFPPPPAVPARDDARGPHLPRRPGDAAAPPHSARSNWRPPAGKSGVRATAARSDAGDRVERAAAIVREAGSRPLRGACAKYNPVLQRERRALNLDQFQAVMDQVHAPKCAR